MSKLKNFWLVTSSLLLVLIASLGGVAYGNGAKLPKPPFDIPFSLDKGGEIVEVEICIVERQIYTFGLAFKINRDDPGDAKRLIKLMGDAEPRPTFKGKYDLGAPLKIRLQIQSISNGASSVVFDKVVSEIFLYAGGAGDYKKKIINIPLDSGSYKVRVENMLPSPVMAGRPINFHIYRAYLGK